MYYIIKRIHKINNKECFITYLSDKDVNDINQATRWYNRNIAVNVKEAFDNHEASLIGGWFTVTHEIIDIEE